jgi:hypothetical protein
VVRGLEGVLDLVVALAVERHGQRQMLGGVVARVGGAVEVARDFRLVAVEPGHEAHVAELGIEGVEERVVAGEALGDGGAAGGIEVTEVRRAHHDLDVLAAQLGRALEVDVEVALGAEAGLEGLPLRGAVGGRGPIAEGGGARGERLAGLER